MLAIEVIASSMFLIVALVLAGLALTRLLDRAVQHSFSRTARIEAQDLDEEFRQICD